MRIIAGEFKSRRVKPVPGTLVRPTPDRLRETLFAVLGTQVEGSVFLDAYAGSGAVGLEALSRRARRVILIERNFEALEIIRQNVRSLGVEGRVDIVRGNAAAQLVRFASNIAFVDPPYDRPLEYGNALAALAETTCSLAIAQHPSRMMLEERYGSLLRTRVLKQGDNSLSFYGHVAADDGTQKQSGDESERDVHHIGSGGTGADETADSIEEAI
jgi:16S rRNA (guanine(966)-N(2))-methyltransferase RsmD